MNIRCPSCSNALSVAGGHARVQCPFCHTVIELGASAEVPSAPIGGPSVRSSPGSAVQARLRSRSSGSAMQIAAFCGLLILVGVGVIVGLTVLRVSPDYGNGKGVDQPIALVKAQEEVAKRVPGGAEFDDNPKLVQLRDNEWKVESKVRYRDRSGQLQSRSFSARVRQEGNSDWQVEDLEIGGHRVALRGRGPTEIPEFNDADPSQALTPSALEPDRDQRTVSQAMRTLSGVIDEAAKIRKTLIVWLFDTSPSATKWREDVVGGFEGIYGALRNHKAVGNAAGKDAPKLQMALLSFDDEVRVLTDQPIADEAKLREAIGKITDGQGGHERPFAAMQKALEKFGDFAKQGGRLQFVVVTDEAGDDEEKVIETTIPALKKASVQVYVIGREAPLGHALWPSSRGFGAPAGDDPPHHGPESFASERISLQFWQRGFGEETIAVPSGFGPYQLSRVCQQTDGAFFVADAGEWSSGRDANATFDPKTRARYTPRYVSADEYRKFLASNAAARGLHEAAKLPGFELVQLLQFDFVAGNEAQLKQALDRAQQGVARTEPKLNELYALLQPGIADRAKLTEPRLQAAFDLAIGRVLATQARVEGYNAMLAILKGGKSFKNAGSTTWVLQASDSTGAGSKFEKAIKDAQMFLGRVIKDHPNTPWAYFAQRELEAKMGWEWGER
jgi:hypothetical protein